MKKLLLTLAAVVGLGFAATAEEVTFDFTKTTDGKIYGYTAVDANGEYEKSGTITEGPVSFTMTTPSGNGFRFYVSNGAYSLRTYNGSVFTISVPDGAVITKIEFAGNNMNAISYGDPKTVLAAKTATWEGNATSVAFSNTEKKTDNKGKQSNITATLNTIKVTYTPAAGGLEPAGIKYEGTAFSVTLGDNFTEPTLTNPNNLTVTYSSSDDAVATVNAISGAVTIVGVGTTTITASSAKTDKYYEGKATYTLTVKKPIVTETVTLATAMSDGKYAIYTPQGVAKNYTGSNTTYGYLYLEAVTAENNEFTVNVEYLIEFTATDKGYTMKDSKGVYLGMDASHFGSFNFYSDPDAEGSNCYWTVTFEGDDVKIENTGRAGAFISYKKYNNDWEITTTDNADQPLVQLYKVKDSSAITEIEAAENAPVEYFNLQGVRVANPENGLYIRRQGNKVTKVIVK